VTYLYDRQETIQQEAKCCVQTHSKKWATYDIGKYRSNPTRYTYTFKTYVVFYTTTNAASVPKSVHFHNPSLAKNWIGPLNQRISIQFNEF
jgi:hypothetical protein